MKIRLFATLKDKAGKKIIDIPFDETLEVKALLDLIAADYPALATSLPTTLVAVNRNYAERHTPVSPTDEVALFPPVSGG